MANIEWVIENINVKLSEGGHTDVVSDVAFRVFDRDGDMSGTSYGLAVIPLDANASFIGFNSLTKDQVLGWVKAALGPEQVEEVEKAATADLDRQKSPPIVSKPLPWGSNV